MGLIFYSLRLTCNTSFKIIKNSVFCPQYICAFCVDLRTKSEYFSLQHKLVGFYNRSRVFTARYALGIQVGQIQFGP
jgi:hypothetical protein